MLPYDGWHIALYLRDWEGAYRRAAQAGLLYENKRFSDRCATWEEACANWQFRTLAMVAPAAGSSGRPPADSRPTTWFNDSLGVASVDAAGEEVGHLPYRLELEVRSVKHAACPL